MNKGIVCFITALSISIIIGVLLYLIFHFTGTKQISSNGIVLMFVIYTFLDIFQRADKEL